LGVLALGAALFIHSRRNPGPVVKREKRHIGREIITIVDATGVFYLPVWWKPYNILLTAPSRPICPVI